MHIINARPPAYIWDECDRRFGVSRRVGVIFACGDTVYNPSGVDLTSALMAHEGVHGARQAVYPGGVFGWWDRYLIDPAFRLTEEIPAHVAELRTYLAAADLSRPARRLQIKAVAARLASPLYGRLISFDKAKELLKSSLDS
jgi:hypothetical protein